MGKETYNSLTHPKEGLKVNFFIHVLIRLCQDSLNLILGEEFSESLQFLKNGWQISHSNTSRLSPLRYILEKEHNTIHVSDQDSDDEENKGTNKQTKKQILTLDLRVRSSTWVNWLWSHWSETRTPTKLDMLNFGRGKMSNSWRNNTAPTHTK